MMSRAEVASQVWQHTSVPDIENGTSDSHLKPIDCKHQKPCFTNLQNDSDTMQVTYINGETDEQVHEDDWHDDDEEHNKNVREHFE